MAVKKNSNLTHLGRKTKHLNPYSPNLLERFENNHLKLEPFITLDCPEFTSLCPITEQPDFAHVHINYIPHKWCVESKSLKLYLFSFRNHGSFHEDCICTILQDLDKLLKPHYIEVIGKFMPRGGISIDPFVNKSNSKKFEVFANQRKLTFHI